MLHLQIVTPEKIIFDEQVDEVILPTVKGEITVLPHHVPILTQLASGEITIKIKDKKEHLAVVGGFVEVSPQLVTILADFAIHAKDVSEAEAKAAKDRAEKAMNEKLTEEEVRVNQTELIKAILQLKVAKRIKHAS